MNTSTIAVMIGKDPSITDDPAAFCKRMNEQNIRQVVRTRDVVVDEEKVVSFAELNGGPATERDVADAVAFLAAEPLREEAKERSEKLLSAIASGEVTTSAELKQMFTDIVLDVIVSP